MIQPTKFVRIGSIIDVRFVDGNDIRWYRGEVKEIHDITPSSNHHGNYVTCSVLYEDGDFHSDTELYDKDFENEDSLDAWRFAFQEWNELIQVLQDHEYIIHNNGQDDDSYTSYEVVETSPQPSRSIWRVAMMVMLTLWIASSHMPITEQVLMQIIPNTMAWLRGV